MKYTIFTFTVLFAGVRCWAQAPAASDSLLPNATLDNCVQYAVKHQPVIQQSLIDETTTDLNIQNKLADWYPQVNLNYNLQHNFQLQKTVFNGTLVPIGVNNTSTAAFTATQNIFNRDVLLAYQTKGVVRDQARQTTSSNKIDVAASVSKAFYDVLATTEQIKVNDEDIVRLERSLHDAQNQYNAGVADKTDYKRATITLNNARATRKSNTALLKAKLEYLKSLMGYPVDSELKVVYDSLQMEKEVTLDTLQSVDYTQRIEYRLLQTQKKLYEANLKYQKWAYIPSVSANGAYNMNYLNNDFGKLYNDNYPNSYVGLTVAFPIFQGGKRKYNTAVAEWQVRRTNLDIIGLKNNVNAQYAQALAYYKSNFANYTALKDNLNLAKEVYDIIQLQYRSGVKTYLEVITAEADLRTAQINYYNALYELLSSKVDVQKALGQIKY